MIFHSVCNTVQFSGYYSNSFFGVFNFSECYGGCSETYKGVFGDNLGIFFLISP